MEVVPLGASVLGSAGSRVGMREGDSAKVPTSCASRSVRGRPSWVRRMFSGFFLYLMQQFGAWSLGEETCLEGGPESANKHLLKSKS